LFDVLVSPVKEKRSKLPENINGSERNDNLVGYSWKDFYWYRTSVELWESDIWTYLFKATSN